MHTQHIPLARFFGSVNDHMLKKRWWYLTAVALITVFFLLQMGTLRFDNSSDIWFVEGHRALEAKARFDEAFGNYQFVYLLFIREKTAFTPENFRRMIQLADALEENVPYAKRVLWLGNAERIRGAGEQEVRIAPFFETPPETTKEIEQKLDEALLEPSFVGDLISPDKTALSMVIEFYTYPPKEEDLTPQKTVSEAVDTVLARPEFSSLFPWVSGIPHFNVRYSELVKRDMGKLMLLAVLVQTVLLFFFARGLRGIFVPIGITILAVLWTMGTVGLIGFSLNLLSSAIPAMLVCVSIGDAMHAISAFYSGRQRGLSREKALRSAFSEVGFALMLTSFTTAIGFLAYLSCEVVPYREMGIYVAIGVLYAFLLTLVLTPILYSFGKPLKAIKKNRSSQDVFDRWLHFCWQQVTTRPKRIVLCFSSIMLLTFIGYLNMKVESNTSKLIFQGEPLRDALDLVDERMGTSTTLEFLIDTGRESGIKDPAFLKKLDTLMQDAETYPQVTKAASVTSVLKQMRRALHNNNPAFYALPETPEAIAQYLVLYESSGGGMLDRQLGFLYDMARLTIKTPSIDTADARNLLLALQKEIKTLFGDEVTVVISGGMANYIELNDILYEGQRHSFIAALLAISVVMMVVLRSIPLGLLSMIPNIFPVFFTMGFLGLVGYYLDVITISYAAVIIGVAVDDSIHFFTRFRQEFSVSGRYVTALQKTYLSVGRPLTQTTIVLVIGNLMLMFSSLLGFFKLGLLFAVAFTMALLADLFFAPALIMLFKPLGKETRSSPFSLKQENHHA
ncbi:MAG: hypothetical protein CSA26_09515 [Desulfobacterales bacterium]|nr:MAG: hypothetical protein CSA26_09515 [Desulfobacterales bacterium]